MLGVGDVYLGDERMPADRAWRARGLQPACARPEGRSRAAQRHAILPRRGMSAPVRRSRRFQAALITGALATDAAEGSDTASIRDHVLRGHRDRSRWRGAARTDEREPHPRFALIQDDRVQDPYCLRWPAAGDGCGARRDAYVAVTLETEANGVSDNPLILPTRRSALRRQFSRRAGRARRPTRSHLRLARSARLPTGGIAMLVIPRCRPAGVPSPRSRTEFRASCWRR